MISEEALLQQAIRLEEDALIEVYDRYNAGLYRYALALLADEDLAEDCVADTFKRFLLIIQHGKGPARYLQAYLYRIAHNWVSDYFRKTPLRPVHLEEDVLADPSSSPQAALASKQETRQLQTALARLTPDQRQVVVLKYLEDWDHQEIAQALNKPIGAVKALQHRGIQALRRILYEEVSE